MQVPALLRAATADLAAAGVDSAAVDARLLLAHAMGLETMHLLPAALTEAQRSAFEAAVNRRAARVPVQHITGRAYFRHLTLAVGPGVFVPRPETEVMTGWAIDALRAQVAEPTPVVVDLCSGSGAIGLAIATEAPGTLVHAVEREPEAVAWAARNLAGTNVQLHTADLADAVELLADLVGRVTLVIANPPYIPLDAYLTVAREARDHDPAAALFSGADGLDAIRVVVEAASLLLRPGGLLCFEHADVQGESAPAVVVESGAFTAVRDHRDLAGRPRFTTAVRLDR